MTKHAIKVQPGKPSYSKHETGEALDVRSETAEALVAGAPEGMDVQEYIDSETSNPPGCTLRWGGRFSRPDPVHFDLK